MEDEGLVLSHLNQLGQVLHRPPHVDERIPRVVEDPEVAVHAHVDARGLEQGSLVGLDLDPSLVDQAGDGSVGEDHEAILGAGVE